MCTLHVQHCSIVICCVHADLPRCRLGPLCYLFLIEMPRLIGLIGAPKYFAWASAGAAGVGLLMLEYAIPDLNDSISSHLSKAGIIVSAGLMGCNAGISIFNKSAVTDALLSRPHDTVRIMRSAGARAGAYAAASLMCLHIAMDSIVADDSDVPILLRIYATTIYCAVALPFTLPVLGASYGLGSAVGFLIGRRMLEQRCTAGILLPKLTALYISNPVLARALVGSVAAACLWPFYYIHSGDIDDDSDMEIFSSHEEYSVTERRELDGSKWIIERRWSPLQGETEIRTMISDGTQDKSSDYFDEEEDWAVDSDDENSNGREDV